MKPRKGSDTMAGLTILRVGGKVIDIRRQAEHWAHRS